MKSITIEKTQNGWVVANDTEIYSYVDLKELLRHVKKYGQKMETHAEAVEKLVEMRPEPTPPAPTEDDDDVDL